MADIDPIVKQMQAKFKTEFAFDEAWESKISPLVVDTIRAEMKKPGASTKNAVRSVCQGAMTGALLIEKDAAAAVVEVLKGVGIVAQERSGDPMQTMTYALEGISQIAKSAQPDVLSRIQGAIESQFMGAGAVFLDLCHKVQQGG